MIGDEYPSAPLLNGLLRFTRSAEIYAEQKLEAYLPANYQQKDLMTMLNPDRFFSPDPATQDIARDLYQTVATLPIVSPHGHVDPRLFADPSATFGTPADLFIIPDHYVTRMLYSQGIPLETLLTGDHRKVWKLFCENFHLFRGTPSGIWLTHELSEVFSVDEKPSASNSDFLFDSVSEKLSSPDFSSRSLFERFNLEVLATTDAATDGANWWQKHAYITLPQMSAVIEFFFIVELITMLSWVFGYVYTMTGGGPGFASTVMEFYIWKHAFSYRSPGIASALAVVLLGATTVLIALQFRLRRKSLEENL